MAESSLSCSPQDSRAAGPRPCHRLRIPPRRSPAGAPWRGLDTAGWRLQWEAREQRNLLGVVLGNVLAGAVAVGGSRPGLSFHIYRTGASWAGFSKRIIRHPDCSAEYQVL